MSRAEQVNCAALAAILIALLLLAGASINPAPATSATPPVAASESLTDAVTIDDSQEDSGVRGLTVAELEADAWASYRLAITEPEPSGQFTSVPEYFAAFEGSAPELTAGYFAIESKQFPGLFHVIHMVAAQRA